ALAFLTLERNMMIRVVLVLLLILYVAASASAKSNRLSLYRNKKLGIEFKYPSGWIPEPCRGAYRAPNCVGFKPKRRRGAGQDYLLTVSVSGKRLEDTAREDGRFQQSGGKGVMLGRLGFEGEVREVKGWNWEGLYGTTICGITVDGGFHGAAGECCAAFLHHGKRTAKIENDGIVSPDTVFRVVVKSFKFLE
ncbi:MAG: hypothetical protein WCD76_08050, partial [Pyrinomonadaceae bacterium]